MNPRKGLLMYTVTRRPFPSGSTNALPGGCAGNLRGDGEG